MSSQEGLKSQSSSSSGSNAPQEPVSTLTSIPNTVPVSSNSPTNNSVGTPISTTASTSAESDYNNDFPLCDDVNKYEKITKIGQGTFGEVFKARHVKTKKLVALKKVLMENEKQGFPITALREIKILKELKHENVIKLIEVCCTSSNEPNYKATFYLVFDFCEHDLAGLLSNVNVKFTLSEIKKVMKQLLDGLYYIHFNKILHRDMKTSNILITKSGVLKLADFGLSRTISDWNANSQKYTNRVVTLWYRAPELLLGERNYGPPIDLWGVGCILAEMFTRTPILQGSTEQAQITKIIQLCGVITPEVWPGVEKLQLYHKMELDRDERRKVKERLRVYVKCANALDLVDKLLVLDPAKRLDADKALDHDFFWSDPMPSDLGIMLSHYNNSMFEFTAARQRMQNQPVLPVVVNPPGHGEQGRLGGGPGAAAGSNAAGQYRDIVF